MKRLLFLMIACMISSKASVPHDIILLDMGAALIATEALFQSVTGI